MNNNVNSNNSNDINIYKGLFVGNRILGSVHQQSSSMLMNQTKIDDLSPKLSLEIKKSNESWLKSNNDLIGDFQLKKVF